MDARAFLAGYMDQITDHDFDQTLGALMGFQLALGIGIHDPAFMAETMRLLADPETIPPADVVAEFRQKFERFVNTSHKSVR